MSAARQAAGSVRIIGGRWRGTRLAVDSRAGLRPSGDRVRETLFNWLAPVVNGARCLDLFAGSGVLGLEALSRGAQSVTLVERDRAGCKALEDTAERLKIDAPEIEIVCADAVDWLRREARPYDVVFVDPPFESALAEAALDALQITGLPAGAYVYLEQPRAIDPPGPPWQVWRSGTTRHTRYNLLTLAR